MGTTPNVGLMAQKAEEYGSHDKTFEIPAAGTVRVVDSSGATKLSSTRSPRATSGARCQTKDAPIRDWVRLAVERARATGAPAVFWLDETRAHDAQLIAKVREYLGEHDTDGLTIEILDVAAATRYTLERARRGEDTISVTGNVLRDYLTDLFPILELGTSAKMLSIVPLMAGGGLFETGAGGSAPKHVQQLLKENHLRWDSLGEFLALAVSLEMLASKSPDNRCARSCWARRSTTRRARCWRTASRRRARSASWTTAAATSTSRCTGRRRWPSRPRTPELAGSSRPLAEKLGADEETIVGELNAVQGAPVDLGGYYYVDRAKADEVMRPSATFNAVIDGFRAG